ncbi:hypothetical protein, partial [Mycoplasma struthionis]|uniref:hypothetical protein n=1 Tax=Mycoplasma struthionis TaxID=538220 RepID=UPI001644365E
SNAKLKDFFNEFKKLDTKIQRDLFIKKYVIQDEYEKASTAKKAKDFWIWIILMSITSALIFLGIIVLAKKKIRRKHRAIDKDKENK